MGIISTIIIYILIIPCCIFNRVPEINDLHTPLFFFRWRSPFLHSLVLLLILDWKMMKYRSWRFRWPSRCHSYYSTRYFLVIAAFTDQIIMSFDWIGLLSLSPNEPLRWLRIKNQINISILISTHYLVTVFTINNTSSLSVAVREGERSNGVNGEGGEGGRGHTTQYSLYIRSKSESRGDFDLFCGCSLLFITFLQIWAIWGEAGWNRKRLEGGGWTQSWGRGRERWREGEGTHSWSLLGRIDIVLAYSSESHVLGIRESSSSISSRC